MALTSCEALLRMQNISFPRGSAVWHNELKPVHDNAGPAQVQAPKCFVRRLLRRDSLKKLFRPVSRAVDAAPPHHPDPLLPSPSPQPGEEGEQPRATPPFPAGGVRASKRRIVVRPPGGAASRSGL